MASRIVVFLVLIACADPQNAGAQDAKKLRHNSTNPRKCKKCVIAYEKAFQYLRKNLGKTSFAAKMVVGWAFLADGRYPNDLKRIIKDATQWETRKGKSQHAQNWYPAMAGILLAEYYKYMPTREVQQALIGIVKWFQAKQERTGGWFKWFEGAYKDRLDYAVKDLGMLTSIIYGFLWTVKSLRIPVDNTMMKKADACLLKNHSANGISYGTGSRGSDRTGARGAFLLLGLDFARQHRHRIYKNYVKLLPRRIPNLDKGHHVGAFHCLGITLGCHRLGPKVYAKLTQEWLDKLIAKQKEDGSVYVGDDGDAGGEIKLLRGNHGSTAAFALLILLQDARILRGPKKRRR